MELISAEEQIYIYVLCTQTGCHYTERGVIRHRRYQGHISIPFSFQFAELSSSAVVSRKRYLTCHHDQFSKSPDGSQEEVARTQCGSPHYTGLPGVTKRR